MLAEGRRTEQCRLLGGRKHERSLIKGKQNRLVRSGCVKNPTRMRFVFVFATRSDVKRRRTTRAIVGWQSDHHPPTKLRLMSGVPVRNQRPANVRLFKRGDEVTLTNDQMDTIFREIIDELNRIGTELYGKNPRFSFDKQLGN